MMKMIRLCMKRTPIIKVIIIWTIDCNLRSIAKRVVAEAITMRKLPVAELAAEGTVCIWANSFFARSSRGSWLLQLPHVVVFAVFAIAWAVAIKLPFTDGAAVNAIMAERFLVLEEAPWILRLALFVYLVYLKVNSNHTILMLISRFFCFGAHKNSNKLFDRLAGSRRSNGYWFLACRARCLQLITPFIADQWPYAQKTKDVSCKGNKVI